MDHDTVRLETPATPSAPALVLRPWRPEDADDLASASRDELLRRWVTSVADDRESAARWLREQRHGWETGTRYAFAVVERLGEAADGPLVGHTVLKRRLPDTSVAEVGYWTAAHARGRGVAPRALDTLTEWAFTVFAGDGLTRLELVHQADNTASCRVAEKCGYTFGSLLPAAPPAFPRDGHVHACVRGAERRARVG
ncbi:GNAT family N-acetyltransferase [Streptomyces sp. NBC_00289]|uniref:GNAT family N-acetyltransferase n=1 Tax=Streptomyces sp. NBC_00289 TaxID=2975703 RepID=UPI00324A765C